ncbi:MAG: efflux RND transporter periplasmic adaptor subunit [Thermoanaerobaculia bacterium]
MERIPPHILLALALLTGASALTGCTADEAATAGLKDVRPPAVVRLAKIQQGAFDVAVRFVGRFRAKSAAELFARTEGPLTAVYAGTGDRVRKGQLLARIDDADAQQRVQQSAAALKIAEATFEQRSANLQLAGSQARRSESLFGEKLVSKSDYEIAQGELTTAKSQVELARAQIEQAKANLAAAELELARTRILAPFDGYIGTRYLDLGAQASTNRAIFSIVDVSTIRTTVAVPSHDAVHVHPGQEATVTVDVLPGRIFKGKVSRVSSVFDPQTSTVEAEVEIANSDGVLKPGMFGSVLIAYRTDATALLVPVSAVQRNEHEEWIFVAEATSDDGLAARRVPVRVLPSAKSAPTIAAIEPLEGELARGMNVIVLGQEDLVDGARVTSATARQSGGPKQ